MSAGRRHPSPVVGVSGILVNVGGSWAGDGKWAVWGRAGAGSDGSQPPPGLGFSVTIFAAFLVFSGLVGSCSYHRPAPTGTLLRVVGERERFQSCARLHLLKIAKLGLEGILQGVSKINTIILIINICIGRTTVDLCGETQSLHCLLLHVCGAR